MANDHIWTEQEPLGGSFFGSLLLHSLIIGAVVGAAFIVHKGDSWGAANAQAGAIQASMVSAIPLPSTQKFDEKQVLASEAPSPAPVEATKPTVTAPVPDAIPIPIKNPPKQPKIAEKQVTPPQHPQPVQVKPNVAQTGETSGIRIQQSTVQVKDGSASVTVQDSTFGARYAYYVGVVNRRVAQNWLTQEADPRTSAGRSVTIIFDILRDGTPTNVRMGTRSGSPSLDTSAVHALERVDGFGPLPAGDHITVEYTFNYQPR